MKYSLLILLMGAGLFAAVATADGRGFGGGGGRSFGGYSGGGYARTSSEHYSSGGFNSFSGGDRAGASYSGSHSYESASGWGGREAGGSYDHTWSDAAGGSINTSGSRGAYEGRYGGVAAGSTRDTTVTTAGGRTVSADSQRGIASGPGGRTVGGASGSIDGRAGSAGWQSAFSGNRYSGNMEHYSSVYGANGAHSTAYWSTGSMNVHAGYVRTGFGYYGAFHPAWYTAHPGCWMAAGWAAGAAWALPTYADISGYCGTDAAASPDYEYGSAIVYQDNNVYVGGVDAGTAEQYAQQATTIATQGQTVPTAPTDDWKALGVFALVSGSEKTSNNIFQLAINKAGIIRGNYYDGLMDTTTEVYGSIDKRTQRAAWTIGKKQDRVFEAGFYNLTQPQCPCLLHVGTQTTEQMLLVRMEQPKSGS